MQHGELYRQLDRRIPAELREDWDNDGMMVCPDPERECARILVTLDVTSDAVSYAADNGFDLIISHHPLIFRPVKHLTDPKLISLVQNRISVFSFHTRMDSVSGGVNDVLAALLDLRDSVPFGTGMGRIGTLPSPLSPQELAQRVRDVLSAPYVRYAGGSKPVSRLAVLGGAGGDFIGDAISAGADAYVSGEFSHHHLTDAAENSILLIEAGHFYTENPVLDAFCGMLREICPEAETERFFSDRVCVLSRG